MSTSMMYWLTVSSQREENINNVIKIRLNNILTDSPLGLKLGQELEDVNKPITILPFILSTH